MSNLRVYQSTVVQPDLEGDPVSLTEVRQQLLGSAPPQVFVILGEGQTMLHPSDEERTFASGPCIVLIEGLYDRSGLRMNVLS
jgi:hypothetical protein